MNAPKTSAGKVIAISVGALAVIGTALYFLFRNNTAPAAIAGMTSVPTNIPPVVVSGWKNGNAMYSIAGTTGVLSTNGTATKVGNGPYSLSVNDYDGAGYDVTVVYTAQGVSTDINQVYITNNGSFSFAGKKKKK